MAKLGWVRNSVILMETEEKVLIDKALVMSSYLISRFNSLTVLIYEFFFKKVMTMLTKLRS